MAVRDNTLTRPENNERGVSRRNLLARAPAAGGAVVMLGAGSAMLALPAAAGAIDDSALIDATRLNPDAFRRFAGLPDQPDPHIAWWQEWLDARQAVENAPDDDDKLADRLYHNQWVIEDRIVQTVPATVAGAVVVAAITEHVVREMHSPGCLAQEHHGALTLAAFVRGLAPGKLDAGGLA